jgi:maltose O-acetyltransferase
MKSIIQACRKIRYRLISDMKIVSGQPVIRQPVLFCGKGRIVFEGKVRLGYYPSPYFYSGYSHIEARTVESVIRIGGGTYVSNSCVFISEGPGIKIGQKCLIGPEVCIYDSDFHGLSERKMPQKEAVEIGDNVFIGARVIIVKGVRIGNNATIGAGAVVSRHVPANTVVAGNPAKVVKVLE